MSNQPYPEQPPGPVQGPALGPYAGYGPTPGAPPPGYPGYPPPAPGQPTRDIQQYAPPRTRPSIVFVVVAVVALVGVLLASMLLRQGGTPQPTATPSTEASALPGMPFTVPGDTSSTGRWEVLGREWNDTGVTVHVRVYASTGRVPYGFQAFDKTGTDLIYPTKSPRSPQLTTGTLDAGQVADGYVFLKLPRADSTLFLTTRDGRAISALPIKA